MSELQHSLRAVIQEIVTSEDTAHSGRNVTTENENSILRTLLCLIP